MGHRQPGGCVVTDRALMRATLMMVLCSAFLAVGCQQGVGDRCVQNSDCSSGLCSSSNNPQGGTCLPTGGSVPIEDAGLPPVDAAGTDAPPADAAPAGDSGAAPSDAAPGG